MLTVAEMLVIVNQKVLKFSCGATVPRWCDWASRLGTIARRWHLAMTVGIEVGHEK